MSTTLPAKRSAVAGASGAIGAGAPAGGELAAELLPGPGQPARARAGRAADGLGRLVACQAVEVAQQDRQPVTLRQVGQFLMDQAAELVAGGVVRGLDLTTAGGDS